MPVTHILEGLNAVINCGLSVASAACVLSLAAGALALLRPQEEDVDYEKAALRNICSYVWTQ